MIKVLSALLLVAVPVLIGLAMNYLMDLVLGILKAGGRRKDA